MPDQVAAREGRKSPQVGCRTMWEANALASECKGQVFVEGCGSQTALEATVCVPRLEALVRSGRIRRTVVIVVASVITNEWEVTMLR
jgi:hypothetical protein